MNSNPPPAPSPVSRRWRSLTALLALSGVATLAVNWMESVTRATIAANEQAQALAILDTVLPAGAYDNHPELDVTLLSDRALLGSDMAQPIYAARSNGEVVANVVTVTAPSGYVAPIQLVVGITRDGTITGVRAIRHQETPGLGDRIDADKDDWIKTFSGLQFDSDARNIALREDGGDIDHIS